MSRWHLVLLLGATLLEGAARAAADDLDDAALAAALRQVKPRMSPALAAKHVAWARAATADTEVEVELLLGMAFRESSWDPFSVSRRACLAGRCVRVTGPLRHPVPLMEGPYFCGVMQIHAPSWKACAREAADTSANYRKGALHLQQWLDDPQCAALPGEARLTCALLGYGGVETNRASHPYPRNVRRASEDLRQRATFTGGIHDRR
ncbi:hypothetical protein [Hyphomicrobium sp.]|uniref:hypothetical protein n=1 Tax=Hyphomicrobium sp. TaxID=82 RepID=UPI0025C20CB0|nr:hypothetical protein [Hyphomicrobium sp.]MCC7251200.1 hypothetical protein [Hyphomicrobium sp.]